MAPKPTMKELRDWEDKIDLTIGGLRERTIEARRARANGEFEFVKTMALIQIAQEANEIKTILAADRVSPDLRDWLLDRRDRIWPNPDMSGHRVVNELIRMLERES